MKIAINVATEGYPDEIVIHSICRLKGLDVDNVYNTRGKAKLDKNLQGYNSSAKSWYWLVLRDFDHDADCPPTLRQILLPNSSKYMEFRIVVREIESWLLGDAERFSQYFQVPIVSVPTDPESLDSPKNEVIRLIRRYGNRSAKLDMVPREGSGGSEGPAYSVRLAEFADTYWRPESAAKVCQSLDRCLKRLDSWKLDD